MKPVPREELLKEAKAVNDAIFGRTRRKRVSIEDALKKQVNMSAKFALEKTLRHTSVPDSTKRMFVDLLNEQPDAINILFAGEESKQQAIEMLTPMFGDKTKELFNYFQDTFNALQKEIELDKNSFSAG